MPSYPRPHLPLTVYLAFGLRNLRRNPQRTLLGLTSLLIGIGVVTFLGALVDGWLRNMHDNFVLTSTGHLQVQAPGFMESRSLRDVVSEPEPAVRWLERDPRVLGWTRRVEASGLASVAQGATGVTLLGIEPQRERRTTRLLSLSSPADCLEAEDHNLILGAEVAATLDVRPGDPVVLMGQTPDGELISELFRLCGTLHSGVPELDRLLALAPLHTLQRWLHLGDAVSRIVVRLRQESELPGVVADLRARLPGDRFRVLDWRTLDPTVWQWLRFGELYGLIVLGIVVALVVTQVSNTLLMALYERQREFALMESLGTRRIQLFLMVAWESLLLVALGGALGYAVGALAVWFTQSDGIDFSHFSGAFRFFFMEPVVHPQLTLAMGLKILAALGFAAATGGIYPAWKASRLDPLEAMR